MKCFKTSLAAGKKPSSKGIWEEMQGNFEANKIIPLRRCRAVFKPTIFIIPKNIKQALKESSCHEIDMKL